MRNNDNPRMIQTRDLLKRCAGSGIKIELDSQGENLRIRANKGALTDELRHEIAEQKAELIALLRADSPSIPNPDLARRHDPFPLTDIQQAYVIGRDGKFGLGGACQVYAEFHTHLNLERLERTWQRMIEHHEILRCIVRTDLQQQILRPDELPPFRITVDDLRAVSEEERSRRLADTRTRLTEITRPLGAPLYDLHASLLPDGVQLHVAIELLIADAASIGALFADWEQFYEDPERIITAPEWSFRDYVLAEHASRRGPAWDQAVAYWQSRASTLPAGPDLPRCREPESLPIPRIRRLTDRLSRDQYRSFLAFAAASDLTPSMAVCSAWAEVLAYFGQTDRFALNLTTFQRQPFHPDVNKLIGDFTSTLLLECEVKGASFRERAKRLNEQFVRDLQHARVSGVQVQRMRTPAGEASAPTPAPLVFTSLLGHRQPDAANPFHWGFLGDLTYLSSRTPQIWIDHQVYEDQGQLVLSWDVTEELFPEGFIDALFQAYLDLLRKLSGSAEVWQQASVVDLPETQSQQRAAYNATSGPLPDESIFARFLHQAALHPDDPAIIAAQGELTYGEVEQRSRALAQELVRRGAAAEKLVAIIMPKCWEQLVAAISVVRSGAAYMPVDPDLPPERIALLLESGKVEVVLTIPAVDAGRTWPDGVQRLLVEATPPEMTTEPALPEIDPSQLAYVIYTSGSTGQPKGVMIEHRAAVNTLVDINERFSVRRGDRVLALSSLSFDLSVYDIFGILAVGGAVVVPRPTDLRDPTAWAPLMRRTGVSVWNSVPALLEMLVDYAGDRAGVIPESLRVVMLSGDWIPVSLPERLRAVVPSARVLSLGGATEASIWSIYFPIGRVPADWRSIPYGRPLQNQRFYVLDAEFNDRPVWVTGELYIGGDGLARGYYNDPTRTNERFFPHPRTGDRLYKTGDLGRFLPDGNIEFLGRADTQMKLRGFRIELGEIEATLAQHPEVAACAVVPEGPAKAPTHLVAYVVPRAVESEQRTSMLLLEELAREVRQKITPPAGAMSEETTLAVNDVIDKLVISYTASALLQIGAFGRPGVPWTAGDIMGLGIIPRLHKWLVRALDLLTDGGILRHEGQAWVAPVPIEPAPVAPLWAEMMAIPHALGAQVGLIRRSGEKMPAILTGAIQAVEALFPGGADAEAQELYQSSIFTEANQACREIVSALVARGEPIQALEIGAGVGSTTQHLLPVLPAEQTTYVYTDVSRYFLTLGKEKFAAYPYVRYQLLDAERDASDQGLSPGSFNLVVGSSVLHATRNIRETLAHASKVMRDGGVLLLIEETRFLSLHNVTMGLQQGFDRAEDESLRPRHPLLTVPQWDEVLREAGFTEITTIIPRDPWAVLLGVVVIFARLSRSNERRQINDADLLAHLSSRLPSYMVPAAVRTLDALPLSSNGKVDRGALRGRNLGSSTGEKPKRERVAPSTDLERAIASCFTDVLELPEVSIHDSFLALGGDSLLAAKLCARVREKLHMDLSVRALFSHPTVAELVTLLASAPSASKKDALPPLTLHPEARWEPFPLTEVQQAYLLGRDSAFELSNIGTHAYFEIERRETDGDIEHIEATWQTLIERHDMLRATVNPDGTQVVARQTPRYRIEVADLRTLSPAEVEDASIRTREEMAHQVFAPQTWPLFCVRMTRLPGNLVRLHLSFDMLIVDASSLILLVQEWAALLGGKTLPETGLTFRDYVLGERDLTSHPLYLNARDYWMRRLPSLPAAPDLPLACQPGDIVKPRFSRRTHRLGAVQWELLRQRAVSAELTPSIVLMCAYADTLARACASARFTLNLTLFQRLPLHPDVERIVGDFTSVLLLEVDASEPLAFRERARKLQGQLAEAFDHRYYGGVSMLREMSRLSEDGSRAAAPVIFTSALPLQGRTRGGKSESSAEGSSLELLGKVVYSLAQTSQVWLDVQVYESEGALILNWDAVDGLFTPDLLDEMFRAYVETIHALADRDAAWLETPQRKLDKAQGAADKRPRPMLKLGSRVQREHVAPRDELETSLARCWSSVLGVDQIGVHDNFFALGGDSLLAARLLAELRTNVGNDIPLRMLFRRPTIAELAARLRSLEPAEALPDLPILTPNPAERLARFPMTDVQQAYWLGRQKNFELGGVGTHLYLELDLKTWTSTTEVERALGRLIGHHDMLRTVIRADGQQQVLQDVPTYRITTHVLESASEAEISAHLSRIREELSHQVLDPAVWPLFSVHLTQLPERKLRLHLSIDMLVADSFSLIILMRQWAALLTNPATELPALALTFRDYVVALNELQHSPLFDRSRSYWLRRLETLPEAPPLPFVKDPATLGTPRFKRLQARLPREQWQKLQQKTVASGLSPSVLLMAAYSDALAGWCTAPSFTLNVTLFQRLPLHAQVEELIGDFTALTLLEVDVSQGNTFGERARRLQEQLWEDLDHRFFSGVKVMRELTRRRADRRPARMPVVFTSALPLSRKAGVDALEELMGEVVYSQAESSQVWLDHQVMEDGGELALVWDFVDTLFDTATMEVVFTKYVQSLQALAERDEEWLNPPPMTKPRVLRTAERVMVTPAASTYIAPQTPTEISLATLWERILGGGPYGAEDDFLLAGGDSLLGARLISSIETSFGVTVSMTELHQERTLQALALLIEERVLERELATESEASA